MSISDFMNNTPVYRQFLGFGEIAITNTVDKIHHIIKASMYNPYIRKWAEKIIGEIPPGPQHQMEEVRAIGDFVKYNVRYTKDPRGLEYIQTPPVLLQMIERGETPMGDCDDMTTLSLSLLKSIGYPVATKIASYRPDKKYSHIYGLVFVNNQWLPIDCVKRDMPIGWEAPGSTRFSEKEVR